MDIDVHTNTTPAVPAGNATLSEYRNALFDKLKKDEDARISQRIQKAIEIEYNPRDKTASKRKLAGTSWRTTPSSVARQVGLRSQLDRWLVSRVNGVAWDMERVLEEDCAVEFLDFDDREGKEAFWRSSAHVLGQAAEQRFGCLLHSAQVREDGGFMHEWGPPTAGAGAGRDGGGGGGTVTKSDYRPLHQLSHKTINRAIPFVRLCVAKSDALLLFAHNRYALHTVEALGEDELLVVYRCGTHIDISSGPLLASTEKIKAFELTANSSHRFLSDAPENALQRMHGISFPNKELLAEHKKWTEEASRRDHRKIGQEQELFFFHPTVSPGSTFFLPAGQRVYNALTAYIREEYWKRGYEEVTTPNLFNSMLWKRSGHWQHYREDMFRFDVEKDEWALKPMNCPGHCVLFGHRERTYRELPLRISEFGVLHRNEISGALTGLTRVRRFVQDDAHIFCRSEQVEEEVKAILDWVVEFYHGLFGFTFGIKLSTMPDHHLGDVATWQKAELQLTKALDNLKEEAGIQWEVNPGDGAFYGPKIDIAIRDAFKRNHQCATIQLDFQLPQQFDLEYRTDEQPLPGKQITKAALQSRSCGNESESISADTLHDERAATVEGLYKKHETYSGSIACNGQIAVAKESSRNARQDTSVDSRPDKTPTESGNTLQIERTAVNSELPSGEDMKEAASPSSKDPELEPGTPNNPATHPKTSNPPAAATPHPRQPTPGFARPVMIHRSILGSLERFIAILCEHTGGCWPFWLSPRQILIVPVAPALDDYAAEVRRVFRRRNLHADADLSRNTLPKKIRDGRAGKYNFIFVVGVEEREAGAVNVRNREDPATHNGRGKMVPLDLVVRGLVWLRDERRAGGVVDFGEG